MAPKPAKSSSVCGSCVSNETQFVEPPLAPTGSLFKPKEKPIPPKLNVSGLPRLPSRIWKSQKEPPKPFGKYLLISASPARRISKRSVFRCGCIWSSGIDIPPSTHRGDALQPIRFEPCGFTCQPDVGDAPISCPSTNTIRLCGVNKFSTSTPL